MCLSFFPMQNVSTYGPRVCTDGRTLLILQQSRLLPSQRKLRNCRLDKKKKTFVQIVFTTEQRKVDILLFQEGFRFILNTEWCLLQGTSSPSLITVIVCLNWEAADLEGYCPIPVWGQAAPQSQIFSWLWFGNVWTAGRSTELLVFASNVGLQKEKYFLEKSKYFCLY